MDHIPSCEQIGVIWSRNLMETSLRAFFNSCLNGSKRLSQRALAVVLLFCVADSVSAQPAGAFQPRDWMGRPVQRSCNASVRDTVGLKATLLEHERHQVGFEGKWDTGWFYGNRLRNAVLSLESARPDDILRRIRQNLQNLKQPTAILVYDAGLQRNEVIICAWLITREGIAAAETVRTRISNEYSVGRVASATRTTMGVTAIQLQRAPKARGIPKELNASPNLPGANEVTSELRQVSDVLLPGTIRATLLRGDIKRLLIFPTADISTVPFPALPLGEKAVLDLASVVILAEINGLFDYANSDKILDRHGRKLIIGNPDSSTDELAWADLEGAATEAREVDRITAEMTGPLLIGLEADKMRVLNLLRAEHYSLIYFASHGLSESTDPISGNFLLLSRGRLTGGEISGLSQPTKPIVVMSACQSGLGKNFEGGTFGLARAFRRAGAGQILMSLWDISDEATKALLSEFMRLVYSGSPPEEALRQAMLAARDRRNFTPALWSGFAIYGMASDKPQ
jgi:CHAT domain-containing protein